MQTKSIILLLAVIVQNAITCDATTFGDDFNDSAKDLTKWGTDIGSTGLMLEEGGELVYRLINAPRSAGSIIRPWLPNHLPYNANWVVEFEVFYGCTCGQSESMQFGLYLENTADKFDNIQLNGYDGGGYGFEAIMRTDGVENSPLRETVGLKKGVLHIEFDSTTKVISLEVGTETTPTTSWNPIAVGDWTNFGTYGVSAAGGGTLDNKDWGLTGSDTFSISVFGSVLWNGSYLAQGIGELFRVTIESPGFWTGAIDLGGGWWWLDWFGYFNTGSDPFIYHQEHGWMYPVGTDMNSIWLWDSGMNAWWWTSAASYPYLFRSSDGAWLYYLKSSTAPRWFYNYTTSNWETW